MAVVIGNVALGAKNAGKGDLAQAMAKFEAAHPGVHRIGGEVEAPVLVRSTNPEFPKDSWKKKRILGPIIVEAIVSATGQVVDPTIVSSGNDDLWPAVLAAVGKWEYQPARLKGKSVPVFMIITVSF